MEKYISFEVRTQYYFLETIINRPGFVSQHYTSLTDVDFVSSWPYFMLPGLGSSVFPSVCWLLLQAPPPPAAHGKKEVFPYILPLPLPALCCVYSTQNTRGFSVHMV
jgi:hypothetical protein